MSRLAQGARFWLAAALLLFGGAALAQGSWIQVKAWLAQQLLELAWQRSLADGAAHRPWPWADHWPVARLSLADRHYIVLEGDSGHSLAFGPGRSPASGVPGGALRTVISGHRDTHFAVLERIGEGAPVALTTRAGVQHYQVVGRRIMNAARERLVLHEDGALLLVTCWPFRASVVGGDERLVIQAAPL